MSLIAVGCGKGSPGCTFVAINLAAAIAASVGEALLIDLDSQGADISAYLGLDPMRGLYPLMRLEGRVPSPDSLLREAEPCGDLLCIGGFPRAEDADVEMIRKVLDACRETPGTVVADLGRVSPQTADLFTKADLVLIAVGPDMIGTYGAERAIETLKRSGVAEAKVGAVITGWEWRRAGDLAEVVQAVSAKVIGTIPLDRREARRALAQQRPLNRGSAAKAFSALAAETLAVIAERTEKVFAR